MTPGVVQPLEGSTARTWWWPLTGLALLADRAMAEFDLGFAILESVLGVAVGLLACFLGACWHITTPVPADPAPDGDYILSSECAPLDLVP